MYDFWMKIWMKIKFEICFQLFKFIRFRILSIILNLYFSIKSSQTWNIERSSSSFFLFLFLILFVSSSEINLNLTFMSKDV